MSRTSYQGEWLKALLLKQFSRIDSLLNGLEDAPLTQLHTLNKYVLSSILQGITSNSSSHVNTTCNGELLKDLQANSEKSIKSIYQNGDALDNEAFAHWKQLTLQIILQASKVFAICQTAENNKTMNERQESFVNIFGDFLKIDMSILLTSKTSKQLQYGKWFKSKLTKATWNTLITSALLWSLLYM